MKITAENAEDTENADEGEIAIRIGGRTWFTHWVSGSMSAISE